MAYLNKEYKFSSRENFEGFLRAVGLPEDKIKAAEHYNPNLKLVKNADGTYTNFAIFNGIKKETKFTPGVEFDDVVGVDDMPVKSIITIDGNVVTEKIKTAKDTTTFRREYNGDDLTVVITTDKYDGVAKKHYKA